MSDTNNDRATLAGGCFWCIEAVFDRLEGVREVIPGYTGGTVVDPSYEAVCTGTTGHAEAVQVVFDPRSISFEELLTIFFTVHDPTTMNRQGPDVGSQYRSAIFYHDEDQRRIAESLIDELERSNVFDDSIVTEIDELGPFYEAEDYHRDYYERNPNNRYCVVTIEPKLAKLRSKFREKLAA